ncbi:hypothetical protein [Pseudomonas oryzae]|uniref:Uncharacterized protein n=1 Tax=Pseudomonas oryzae TaxID=1392877 RepID=A0A1H1R8L1_9PSED|nr:hypothetical protein [Pseudomonas oryzae]SDS32124.1 hypothetical protein SAMN05216221_1563 [Pseudomonas oryzae]
MQRDERERESRVMVAVADSRVDAWAALSLICIVVATAIFWVAGH